MNFNQISFLVLEDLIIKKARRNKPTAVRYRRASGENFTGEATKKLLGLREKYFKPSSAPITKRNAAEKLFIKCFLVNNLLTFNFLLPQVLGDVDTFYTYHCIYRINHTELVPT